MAVSKEVVAVVAVVAVALPAAAAEERAGDERGVDRKYTRIHSRYSRIRLGMSFN